MSQPSSVIAGVGLADRTRKSAWPARMDLAQSLTGLVLGLFMWGHMFFVSSILISKDAMWTITKLFEGYFFFGTAFPGTTRIGKYVINHSFILPGLIGVISSCIAGYLIAGARGIV